MTTPSKKTKPPILFAVTPPGLEELLAQELRDLRFRSVQVQPGGVLFRGSPLKANRVLATASRILMPVGHFNATNFDALVRGAEAIDWERYGGLTPKVTCRKSRLYHSDAVAERLAALIEEGPGTLHCRIVKDRVDLKIDTSGEHLHRRGWRLENGAAPMRETLAARMLKLAGWKPGTALVDPMGGSGTLAIEAASVAAGLAPGRLRTFACESWWRSELMPKSPTVTTIIQSSDRDAAVIEGARRNAERAGVTVDFAVHPAGKTTPPAERGLLVANPPYGLRLPATARAWDQLGALLTGPFAAWDAAILCPHPQLAARLKRPVKSRHALRNGGLRVELLIL